MSAAKCRNVVNKVTEIDRHIQRQTGVMLVPVTGIDSKE